jgi:iron complex transport system substrate-binding protein
MTPSTRGPRHRIALIIAALLAAAAVLPACDRQTSAPPPSPAPRGLDLPDYTLTARPVPPDAPGPHRVIAAAPSVTELLYALGLGERLVGRTRYCLHPPAVQAVPSFGALIDANIETLVALEPDLILLSGTSRQLAEQFTRLNLPHEALPDDTLDDLFAAIRRTGELFDLPERAAELVERIDADLQTVAATYADTPPATVLLLIGTLSDPPAPPFIAGPGSFYDDLLKRLGHRNAVSDGGLFAPLSLETITGLDPDVIIELDSDGSARPNGDADARAAWARVGQLSAVRNGRVHVLAGRQHYLLGPRIAQTAAALAEAIAGDSEP